MADINKTSGAGEYQPVFKTLFSHRHELKQNLQQKLSTQSMMFSSLINWPILF